jgi:hypothetical protein
MESIIQPYNVHRGRFYDAPYLNHFNINDFIHELNGRNGIVPIYLDMGCCLWVRVRFTPRREPEILSLFMHSDAYGQYGESTSDVPRLESFKEGYIEYNPNSFSNFNGYNNVNVNANANANANANNIVQNIGTSIGTGVGSVDNVGPISDNIVNNITNNNVNNINNNIDNNIIDNTIIINDSDGDDAINYIDYDDDAELNELINDLVDNIESDDETLLLDNVNGQNNNADYDSNNDYVSSDDEDLNDNSDDIRQPIPIVACPLCRTVNIVESEVYDIRGSSDTCVVCMDRNVQIFLGGCGHACMCIECYNVIREHS